MCAVSFCCSGTDCQGSCGKSAHSGVEGALTGSNGQACYYFSNGCTPGCDECDGTVNHHGRGGQQFLYKGMNQSYINDQKIVIPDLFNPKPGDMVLDPATKHTLHPAPGCKTPNGRKPTICKSSLRTVNTQAECGSADDVYYWTPWRAPGSAPVIDSCGAAGGRFPGMGIGGAGAQYQNTTLAKIGQKGSALPPLPSGSQATWRAGAAYEVGWTVAANHGGGYAYRMAPADGPLTEASFGKMALDFVGNSTLRWDGDWRTQITFNTTEKGWETNAGTTPAGSTWRKNPIPSGLWQREGPSYEPVCQESEACIKGLSNFKAYGGYATGPRSTCRCSGWSSGAGSPLLPNLEVVDSVRIPKGTKPGEYVLQWRWDCEESDQIWASCSDVTITA